MSESNGVWRKVLEVVVAGAIMAGAAGAWTAQANVANLAVAIQEVNKNLTKVSEMVYNLDRSSTADRVKLEHAIKELDRIQRELEKRRTN